MKGAQEAMTEDFHALSVAMMQFARKHRCAVVLLSMAEGTRLVLSSTNVRDATLREMLSSFDAGKPIVDELRQIPKTGDA